MAILNIWHCLQIKKKYSSPSATQEEKTFPEGLMKLIGRSGFFRRDPNKDGHLDSDTSQTISNKPTLKYKYNE